MSISTGAAIAIGAGSTVANVTGGIISGRKNYKYTKKLQKAQNEWSEKMWNATNEYNLPVNQVKRYRDAGINPALVASNGQLSSGNASDSVSPGSSQFNGFDFSNTGSEFMNSMLGAAQLNKIDSEVKNTNSNTDKNLLDLLFGWKSLPWRLRGEQGFQLSREKSVDVLNNNLTLQDWEIKKRQQDYVTAGIQQDILQSNLPWLKGQEQFRLANIMADTYMKIASGDLSYKQCEKLTTDMLVNYEQIGLMRSQSSYYNAAAYNQTEQGNNARDLRLNGGTNPAYMKALEVKCQKETSEWMREIDFKYRKKEWLQNPHQWIQDVNNLAHSVSEFMPWKIASSSSSYNPNIGTTWTNSTQSRSFGW